MPCNTFLKERNYVLNINLTIMDYPIFRLPKNGNSGSLLVLKVQAGIILSIFIIALCFPWISNGQITEGTYNLIDAEADTVLVQITDEMV